MNFKTWLFRPGMLFKELPKWWSPEGSRPTPHEGIDFCCFITQQGPAQSLSYGISIPAAFAGTVVKIFPDFLGWSVLVRHEIFHMDACLYSLYAHTIPFERVKGGHSVKAGEAIASLADSRSRGAVPPHLHLSGLWIPAHVNAAANVNWQTINDPRIATLCDPLTFLEIDLVYEE